jgi:hypothetical protein
MPSIERGQVLPLCVRYEPIVTVHGSWPVTLGTLEVISRTKERMLFQGIGHEWGGAVVGGGHWRLIGKLQLSAITPQNIVVLFHRASKAKNFAHVATIIRNCGSAGVHPFYPVTGDVFNIKFSVVKCVVWGPQQVD